MPKRLKYKVLDYSGSEPASWKVVNERIQTEFRFASHEAAAAYAMRSGLSVEPYEDEK